MCLFYPSTGVRPCLSVNCQSKAEVHVDADVTSPALLSVNAEKESLLLSCHYRCVILPSADYRSSGNIFFMTETSLIKVEARYPRCSFPANKTHKHMHAHTYRHTVIQ